MTSTETAAPLDIGTPLYKDGPYSCRAYIAGIEPAAGNSFMLSTLRQVRHNYRVVFLDADGEPARWDILPDGIVAPWVENARRMQMDPALNAEELYAQAADKVRADQQARAVEREKQQRAREAFKAEAAAKVPSWAKAVIYASREIDDCDSMTDYYNTKTDRVLILGFSRHTRDLFPELRKFAAHAEETRHLATAATVDRNGDERTDDNKAWWHPRDEHREKYSMGAGYYLKDGGRYSTGWKVEKRPISGPDSVPTGEWRLGEDLPDAEAPTVAGAVRIEEHTHTKKGFQMFLVILADRVERAEYERLLAAARAGGGWYSRKWGKCPAGFAFKDEDAAKAFAASIAG